MEAASQVTVESVRERQASFDVDDRAHFATRRSSSRTIGRTLARDADLKDPS